LAAEFPRLRKFATLSPIPGFRSWLKQVGGNKKVAAVLAQLEGNAWLGDKALAEDLGHELEPLCAYYLTHAKQGREPLDPVARFHLRNGARLERINWLGDTSALGIERSAGLMVNYVYRLDDVERNHELYTKQYKVIASHHIDWLAKRCALAAEPAGSR
jgi:malonyl-CoA decarboxylase